MKFGLMILKMLFKDISILISGGHFVQWKGNTSAISIEGIMENINVKMSSIKRICCIKNFLFLALVAFFVRRSRTICAILVEGIMWNIHVKFGQAAQEMLFKRFF